MDGPLLRGIERPLVIDIGALSSSSIFFCLASSSWRNWYSYPG